MFFFDGEVFVKYVDILTSVTSVCCVGDTVYAASGKTVYIVRNDLQIGRLTMDDEVSALYQDTESGVIIVTSDGFYRVLDGKNEPLQPDVAVDLTIPVREDALSVTSYANTGDGSVLVGTREGLFMFTPEGTYLFGKETLPDQKVNDVFVADDRKEIWAATDLGICRLQFDSSI